MNAELGPLFEIPAKRPLRVTRDHRASFERFHRDNPAVYAEIVSRARELKRNGVLTQWSTKAAFEVLRYEMGRRTLRLPGEPKLNNSHTSHYARLIVKSEPDLADFFELRGDDEGGDA